jgi:hypothetical protein
MAGAPKRRAHAERDAVAAQAASTAVFEHAAVPANRDARFRHVLNLFAVGAWRKGVSDLVLAAAWGVDDSTVRHLSAEAGRWFRMSPKFKRQIRADRAALCMRLLDLADRAREKGELKAEATALDLYGEYADLRPSSRTEITGPGGAPVAIAMATATKARQLIEERFRGVKPNAKDDAGVADAQDADSGELPARTDAPPGTRR